MIVVVLADRGRSFAVYFYGKESGLRENKKNCSAKVEGSYFSAFSISELAAKVHMIHEIVL